MHALVQVPVPVLPQLVVQLEGVPRAQAKSSSGTPSQSSSTPLHVSAGGAHAAPVGSSHALVQAPVPVVPHAVVHETLPPTLHVKPSSGTPSQSSSTPLQLSTGGVQADAGAGSQAAVQVPVPIVPQVVVHTLALPAAQVNESSTAPSQSSSMPLQISAGGTHAA